MDTTEKHTGPDVAPMANHEELKYEAFLDNTEEGIQYATPFKLAAIMFTINLSTMIAALDLVRS
jgi:hypothetical protein